MRLKFFSNDSKIKYIFHWCLIYVIVIAFGCILAFAGTFLTNTDKHSISKYDLEYYQENGTFNPNVAINGANNLIYDKDGQLLDSCTTGFLPKNWDKIVQTTLQKVQTSNDYYYAIKSTTGIKHPAIVISAYPLDNGDVFIFFREAQSFQKTFFIIFIISTFLIITMAIYMYLYISMEQKAKKMQRDYIDNITHELKSPLASFRALTTAMYDGLVKDENKQKHYCSIMLDEVNNLERTVSDMLELSRIQNKQIDCAKSVYTAHDLFGDVIEKRKALCEDLDIELRMSPQLEEYPFMYTNQKLAARLLDILLDNAIKFTPVDGFVHLYMTYNNRTVTITVRDSGAGISKEDAPHIFERFYKCDKAHNEKGSGLGLAIAKEIADSLGEKLWLKTTRPEGAEFSFTIQRH